MPRRQETVAAFPGIEPLFGTRARDCEKSGGSKSNWSVQLALPCLDLAPLTFLCRQMGRSAADADEMAGLPAHRQIVPGGLGTLLPAIRTYDVFTPGAVFLRVAMAGIHFDQ